MDNKRTVMPNGRFTDSELELFKNVFGRNSEKEEPILLKILRKVMLELSLSEKEEITFRKTFEGNKPLNGLMRKIFLPTLDGDVPLGQQLDLWLTVNLENKLPDESKELIDSRKLVINYLSTKLYQMEAGTMIDHKPLDNFDLTSPIELKARNTIIMHVEHMLLQIDQLAGFKKETLEETVKRNQLNSSK